MPQRVHMVRTRGGNKKFRALRLDQGVFSWATEAISRKVRIIDVVYNASNNELVRTKTLVKGAIVTIDSTPFRQWYESHYATALGRKKKLLTAKNPPRSQKNTTRERKTPKSPPPLSNSSNKVVRSRVSLLALDSLAAPTVTSLKAKNSISTSVNLRLKRPNKHA